MRGTRLILRESLLQYLKTCSDSGILEAQESKSSSR